MRPNKQNKSEGKDHLFVILISDEKRLLLEIAPNEGLRLQVLLVNEEGNLCEEAKVEYKNGVLSLEKREGPFGEDVA